MKSAAETRAIFAKLERQHPNAQTELHYQDAFQLLVATILSAQTTDERVNQVTPTLFARYPNARSLATADLADVESLIHPTGFYAQKARSIVGMAARLVEAHGGDVPRSMDALVELPGVGRKTANVVLGHALGVPGLAVDRHVLRVSNRIGIADSDDPEVVEQQLCEALPKTKWTVASDTLILHGRRICKPKPLCDRCAVRAECEFFQTGGAATIAPVSRPVKALPKRTGRAAKPKAASGARTTAKRSLDSKPTRRPPTRRSR